MNPAIFATICTVLSLSLMVGIFVVGYKWPRLFNYPVRCVKAALSWLHKYEGHILVGFLVLLVLLGVGVALWWGFYELFGGTYG